MMRVAVREAGLEAMVVVSAAEEAAVGAEVGSVVATEATAAREGVGSVVVVVAEVGLVTDSPRGTEEKAAVEVAAPGVEMVETTKDQILPQDLGALAAVTVVRRAVGVAHLQLPKAAGATQMLLNPSHLAVGVDLPLLLKVVGVTQMLVTPNLPVAGEVATNRPVGAMKEENPRLGMR